MSVAPLAGAWIEIEINQPAGNPPERSLPLRERGLKYLNRWLYCGRSESLPLRERGLKLAYVVGDTLRKLVAPLAGAWIEI